MQSLALAMKAGSHEGLALPNPIHGFDLSGAYFRRGQVSLVAAASGGGKSALATHIAVHSSPKIPTLYLSADSDKVTLGTRIASSVMDLYLNDVESLLREGDPDTWTILQQSTNHIWFYWESCPSMTDIYEEIEAYAYVTGAWPHLIVIDNLINIDPQGEAGHIQKDSVMHRLQELANVTNSHVMVLHHVTGEYENGDQPIPKNGLLDKVAKRPRLVVTLFKVTDHLLGVRIVKNTTGKAEADASYGFEVAWLPEKCYLKG